MLELKNITKRYEAGEFSVDALKGISLQFRSSEFVSVLGPSGCGKTTLLNIVGGLDKYSDGDLVINGTSTKQFNDRDWDSYRNHSVGFVFQSYNLIPHQTVLQNVELALALSGINYNERVTRAKAALDKVGLAGMYHKRPNEMSGGQMQRVAIARAIVNNPDIILADEPTGALDTETSVQVMEILKEISKDRLVVMVTHNPDLAEKYSTRIVRMLDGNLVDDSNPLSAEELQTELDRDAVRIEERREEKANKRKNKVKKPKMSFFTSFMLSLKNLFTKRGRTVLTSFAGSIGIIGIALIYAVSQGTNNYIAAVQEDTLASYPVTINQTETDVSSLYSAFVSSAQSDPHELDDKVYEKLALQGLANSLASITQTENDLAAYKTHLDTALADSESALYEALNGVHYSYDVNLQIYTQYISESGEKDDVIVSDTSEILTEIVSLVYGADISSVSLTGTGLLSSLYSTGSTSSVWEELLPAKDGGNVNDLLKTQYDLIYGKWPDSGSDGKNQVVLVVDENNEIDDMTLYALGLKSREEIYAVIEAAQNGESVETSSGTWTFEEICNQKYKTIFTYECYEQSSDGTWYDKREIGNNLQTMFDDDNVGMELEIVGIIRPNQSASSHMLSGTVCYTQELTKYMIENARESKLGQAQLSNPSVDVFTGLYFENNSLADSEKAEEFKEYVRSCSVAKQAEIYLEINSEPSETQIAEATASLEEMADSDPDGFRDMLIQALQSSGSSSSTVENYIRNTDIENLKSYISYVVPQMVKASLQAALYQSFAQSVGEENVEAAMAEQLLAAIEEDEDGFSEYTDAECAEYFDTVMTFSDSTYDENISLIGCLDLSTPSSISLYAVSFSAKQAIEDDIDQYNSTVPETQKIEYTDYVGLIMSGVTTILDAITYVLIAFVSISLIVSSIMIGVITLISVQERTKEIGILRAIGASKRNVSGMFNAETVIIGFTSGVFGVVLTYILCVFVNLILHSLTGIMTLNATLPIGVAAILIGISMLLTLIAGIIPSRSAAKKDPVVALRTE